MPDKREEVPILDDDLELDTHVTAQQVFPDHNQHNDHTYQGYLGDGEYAD